MCVSDRLATTLAYTRPRAPADNHTQSTNGRDTLTHSLTHPTHPLTHSCSCARLLQRHTHSSGPRFLWLMQPLHALRTHLAPSLLHTRTHIHSPSHPYTYAVDSILLQATWSKWSPQLQSGGFSPSWWPTPSPPSWPPPSRSSAQIRKSLWHTRRPITSPARHLRGLSG